MPLPPSTDNYEIGGATIVLGGIDLGNIVSLEIDPSDVEILDHFTARSGARKIDKRVITQKRLLIRAELDEHAMETYRRYFMGTSGPGLKVQPLTAILQETNIYMVWRNEAAIRWSFSHTKCTARPSGPMDMGEFDAYATYELEIEPLFDSAQVGKELGEFTFTV